MNLGMKYGDTQYLFDLQYCLHGKKSDEDTSFIYMYIYIQVKKSLLTTQNLNEWSFRVRYIRGLL